MCNVQTVRFIWAIMPFCTLPIIMVNKTTTNLLRYIRYTFLSNHNIHKSSCGLCLWASDPLIERF